MRKHGISKTKGDRVLTALFYVLLTLFSLLCLYPLMLAFAVAFSSEQAVSANGFSIIPQDPSLDTFRYLLSQKMNILIQGYGMTTLITLVGTSCSLIITLMYAFSISMPGFRHANKFSFFAYFTMLFNGGMLPWYILCTQYYHLANTIWGLFLPYGMNVFNMFLMRNYLKTIPVSIYEAARIDGAGYGTIFFRVTLPLSQVGLITVGLFYGLSFWNDFYLPLMLITDDSLTTIGGNRIPQNTLLWGEAYQKLWECFNRKQLENQLAAFWSQASCRPVSSHREEQIQVALEYINERYANKSLSMGAVAEHLRMSPSHFSRLFKDIMEESFPSYVNRLRLSSAYQRLLDERDNTIEKIAQESGFYSSSYFTTLFRKQYGLSPSQARRRLSEKGE